MTASDSRARAAETARAYYDSDDADRFYSTVWGGEDIHIGLYEAPDEPIAAASRRTVERMASLCPELGADTRVLDLGSGYGGAARQLARAHGCRVVGLNLSEVENQRARRLCAEQGLGERIDIVEGRFEEIPFPPASFDLVWSQDALLHSGDRAAVIGEVARVLAPGGRFVFTDPMQADGCPPGALQPILDRLHLTDLGSPAFYRDRARQVGLEVLGFEELTPQLVQHYTRVLAEIDRQRERLADVSSDYLERMKVGLRHWIEGGREGRLVWGILQLRKPPEGDGR